MNSRRMLAQFGSVVSGRILSAALQGVLLVLIARAITPGQFGLLSATLGASLLAQAMFDGGLTPLILRERAIRPDSALVAAALRLNGYLSIALFLTAALVLTVLGWLVEPDILLLLPLALWMSAERSVEAWLGVVFADGDTRANFSSAVGKRLLSVLLFLVLERVTPSPLLSFAIASAVPSALSAVLTRRYVARRLGPLGDQVSMIGLLREAWPFWLNSMATQANNLDVSIATMAAGSYQAGIFATASRLTSPLRILPTSMARAILPAASRDANPATRRHLMTYAAGMLIAMSIIYLSLCFSVPALVPLALGSQYEPAIRPLQVVLLGLPFAAGTSLAGALLQGAGLRHYVASVSLTTTALYLPLVAVAMIGWGAIGAAIALAGSYLIQFGLLLSRVIRLERSRSYEHGPIAQLSSGD